MLDSLSPGVYRELRRLAAYHLKYERPNHTLRPTDLVHEVYLRLCEQRSLNLKDQVHFFSLASSMMRRVLVNHAKRRGRKKRGDGAVHLEFEELGRDLTVRFGNTETDLIALDEALRKLARRDPRQMRIVQLHFYGGLGFEEIAEVLEVSRSTVMRDWRMARNWLYLQLKYEPRKQNEH